MFAEEKARVENILNLAREKVEFYQTMLGITESKLGGIEDLIGNIRFRLQQRGISTHLIKIALSLPAPSGITMGAENLENGHPSGTYTYSSLILLTFF